MTGGQCVPQGVIPSSTGSEVRGLPLSAANWGLLGCSEAHGSSCSRASSLRVTPLEDEGPSPAYLVFFLSPGGDICIQARKTRDRRDTCERKVHYRSATLRTQARTCQVPYATLAHFFFASFGPVFDNQVVPLFQKLSVQYREG